MGQENENVSGPDLTLGIAEDSLNDGDILLGHVGDKTVLLSKIDGEFYAIGGKCSHYGAPLIEGIVTGDIIHCPWHHSSFSLKTGEAHRTPALTPVSCWNVERKEGKILVTGKKTASTKNLSDTDHKTFLIVGGGAAGIAATVQLRREGFQGHIHLLSEDESAPYDRPNLSKDYLAGNAQESWIPLFNPDFFQRKNIQLELGVKVMKLDGHRKHVFLADGRTLKFDACLLATGGQPAKPHIPGVEKGHVFTLRSLKDCRSIIDRTSWAQKVAIIGAGFIGMEVAASLRERNMEVHVIAPEGLPMLRTFGVHIGSFLKRLHEEHGVIFHLGHDVREIRDRSVLLDDLTTVPCDFVVLGTGIIPNTLLAEQAGIKTNHGILVNEYLETSIPGVFAAGDVARWPDPRAQEHIRVEHWEHAERQGQIAAMNMLGLNVKYDEVPFFWSQQYDVILSYVGHAEAFDRMECYGDLHSKDFAVSFYEDERIAAVATVGRDKESLLVEDALEHFDNNKVKDILENFAKYVADKPHVSTNFFEPSP